VHENTGVLSFPPEPTSQAHEAVASRAVKGAKRQSEPLTGKRRRCGEISA